VADVDATVYGFEAEAAVGAGGDLRVSGAPALTGHGVKIDDVRQKACGGVLEREFNGVTLPNAKHWARDGAVKDPECVRNAVCHDGVHLMGFTFKLDKGFPSRTDQWGNLRRGKRRYAGEGRLDRGHGRWGDHGYRWHGCGRVAVCGDGGGAHGH
jgi:hypothetical protein